MYDHKKFKGKKACVLGMGKSGAAAAKLLKRRGFEVLVYDDAKTAEVPAAKIFECGFMVKSPGILPSHKILKKFKKTGRPVFSEIEIAIASAPKSVKIFAITGTNGKSTATELMAQVLRAHAKGKNKKVYALGNVGRPFADFADTMPAGSLLALEVSSYQLEDSSYFKPDISALLNITPDHLEHHGSLKKYAAAKCKIFEHQGLGQAFITNGADKNCVKELKKAKCRVFTFSSTPKHSVRVDVFYDGDELIFADGRRLKPPKHLPGMHNIENAMAVALMAFAAGVSAKSVQKGFDSFKGLEHRIEFFAEHKGIKCYNDSKATNVDSSVTALKALQSQNKIWLILGGREKGFPYDPLLPLIKKYCKEIVLIGEAAPNIKRTLGGTKKGDIKSAVAYILGKAKAGDIMLLSPACASFDQFKNFEDRGRQFKQAVTKHK